MISTVSNLTSVIDHDGAAVHNPLHNQITTLDAMGGYIWSLIEKGFDKNQIVDVVSSETGESRVIVQQDLDELLDQLANSRLLACSTAQVSGGIAK